jgi:hypothetical protein
MSPTELKMQHTILFQKKLDMKLKYPALFGNVLWVVLSIPSGSLSREIPSILLSLVRQWYQGIGVLAMFI